MTSPIPARRSAPIAASLFALAALSACNSKPTTIVSETPDDQKAALANAKPVELPPAIESTKTYRCKDNSLVYVDWFAGDKAANIRAKKDASPVQVKADQPGTEKTADGGYALSGTAKSSSVEVTLPGKGKESCDA